MKITAPVVPTARHRNLRFVTMSLGIAAVMALVGCTPTEGQAPDPSTANNADIVSQSKALMELIAAGPVTGPAVGAVGVDEIVPWDIASLPELNALPKEPITVAVVTSFSIGYPLYAVNLVKAVGEELGWTVTTFAAPPPGTPQDTLAAMRQAILSGPDAIIAPAVPGVWIAQALDEARAAGIKTVAIQKDDSSGAGFDAYVPVAEGVQKAIIASSIVSESDGKAKSVLINVPGMADANVPAANTYLEGCATCDTEMTEIPLDVMVDQARLQSSVSALLASGAVDYLVWPQGSAPLVGPINAIGTSPNRDTQLLVNNPGPPAMQSLLDGDLSRVVYAPMGLATLIAIEQVSRLVQGIEPIAQDAMRYPISIWTSETAPGTGYNSMTIAQLKDSDWLSPFNKAWGSSLGTIMNTVDG